MIKGACRWHVNRARSRPLPLRDGCDWGNAEQAGDQWVRRCGREVSKVATAPQANAPVRGRLRVREEDRRERPSVCVLLVRCTQIGQAIMDRLTVISSVVKQG